MKTPITKLEMGVIGFVLLLMMVNLTFGQVKYRTKTSGDWESTSIWEKSTDYGSTWSSVSAYPNSTNSDTILINHNVTVTGIEASSDYTEISTGVTLTINTTKKFTQNRLENSTVDMINQGNITVNGYLVLSSGSQTSNQGTITVNGTLVMNSGFLNISGSGTLSYGSNSTIEYSHSQLTTNNEFPAKSGPVNVIISGVNVVSLNSDKEITGYLNLSSNSYLRLKDYTFTCSGVNNSNGSNAFVIVDGKGYLSITKSTFASSTILFPLGNADSTNYYYSPVQFTFSSEGTFSDPEITVRAVPAKHPQNMSTSDYLNRYWTISTSGTMSGYSVNVSCNYDDNDIQGTEGNIWMGMYNGSDWTLFDQSVPAQNLITGTNLTYLGTTITGGEQGVMPVSLASFVSIVSKKNVLLNWVTSSEVNNSGFDVERKSGNGNWQKIGFVKGSGTKNSPTNYSYEDRNLSTGKYNYRLKQIDYNGNYEYFELEGIAEIGVPDKFDISQNYPNPFNPVTKINFEIPKSTLVEIKLYDMSGREVKTLVNEIKNAGYYTIDFNGSGLSSGVYLYVFRADGFSRTMKMSLVK